MNATQVMLDDFLKLGEVSANILSEHIAKKIAIVRKNFPFADSQAGAQACGKLYSVMLTAAAYNLDPMQYLTMVLTKILTIKSNQPIDELLPWNLDIKVLHDFVNAQPWV